MSEDSFRMKSKKAIMISDHNRGERGAALISAILLSTLLLAAGGTLILTTTMTGITARDSTAEMQAYYAAEAGVSRILEVLRGNVQSSPSGTRASFRNVLCSKTLWTATSGSYQNVATSGTTRLKVDEIIDQDNTTPNCDPSNTTYKPDRLRIRVIGLGPNNSQKKMEIVVNRYTLSYDVDAVVTLPNESGTPINFSLGGSNVTSTSGNDLDGTATGIAAYAVSDSDKNTTNNIMDGCLADGTHCSGSAPNITPSDPAVLTENNTPSFLASVKNAREFLYGTEGMKNAAINQGRYFTTETAAKNSVAGLGASNPDGVFTFVDGNMTIGPGSPSGQGTLIVTGDLTLDGNFNWNGVIMVLGAGRVFRSGGGNGNIYGAMFVAKF